MTARTLSEIDKSIVINKDKMSIEKMYSNNQCTNYGKFTINSCFNNHRRCDLHNESH